VSKYLLRSGLGSGICVAMPDVDAFVKLPEALLPWVGVLGLFHRHELKCAGSRVEERYVKLIHKLI
jgi:hypothetical protein